jgi:hypothetical protein
MVRKSSSSRRYVMNVNNKKNKVTPIQIDEIVLMDGCYLLVKSFSDDGKMVEVTSGGEHDKDICSLEYLMQNNEKTMCMYEYLEYVSNKLDAEIIHQETLKTNMKK